MSKFRDQVGKDNMRVFLNENEFAEVHCIQTGDMTEPIKLPAVVQNETVGNSGFANSLHDLQPGLYGQRVFVSYDMHDYPETPVFGQTMYLDDTEYLVSAVSIDLNLVTVELVANER